MSEHNGNRICSNPHGSESTAPAKQKLAVKSYCTHATKTALSTPFTFQDIPLVGSISNWAYHGAGDN